jgi:hypothetical protein
MAELTTAADVTAAPPPPPGPTPPPEPVVTATVVAEQKVSPTAPPLDVPAPAPPPPKKRKVEEAGFHNSAYYKIRATVADLRVRFVQVCALPAKSLSFFFFRYWLLSLLVTCSACVWGMAC